MKVKTSELTAKQKEILDFITRVIDSGNPPPTRQEIADHFSYGSVNSAVQHLNRIAKKGYIELSRNARGIKLLRSKKTFDEWLSDNRIPIAGNGTDGFYHWMKKAYNAGLAGGIS
ncbi:hypothetical protein [Pectobacterium aroidearum]|uniref:LexA family protein n=1 Tax=Pectobacterium aroidearum TaxID=1201031 RepID=UPI003016E14A